MMKYWFFWLGVLHCSLQAALSEKVVICAICRDAAVYLPKMIPYLEDMGSLFEDYRIVVYENNSEDDTPSQLFRWKRANPKVAVNIEFLSDEEYAKTIMNAMDGQFSRAEQRSLARNKALRMALSPLYSEFSHIICIDMNVLPPSLEEVQVVFAEKGKWDAVFAYGVDARGHFNDWNAFRDKFFLCGPELLGDEWHEKEKTFVLNASDPWYPVYSAFGGFAIYQRQALLNCQYRAIVSADLESAIWKWASETIAVDAKSLAKYLSMVAGIKELVFIESPYPNLPKIMDPKVGIYLHQGVFPMVWKMHSSAYQYPTVCEHVSLHASMYCRGYHRCFIDPRLVCVH